MLIASAKSSFIMISYAVIEFGLIFVAIGLSYVHVKWLKRRRVRKSMEDIMMTRFHYEWRGTEEDEIYAWYRVRLMVLRENETQDRLDFIEKKLNYLKSKPMQSKTIICEDGTIAEQVRVKKN